MRNWAWPESAKKSFLLFGSRSVLRLVALVAAALSVSFMMADNSVVAGVLFQSPVSPAEQPQPVPPQPQPQPQAQPPQPVAPQPVAPQPVAPQPVAPQPQAQPPQPAPEVQPSTQQSPVAQPDQMAPADPLQQPAALDPSAPPPLPVPQPRTVDNPANFDEPEPGSSNLILDRAELVDSVVVSLAYVWLCCGIVLFLLIPLVFLFLHIRGRSKIINEERM